MAYLDVRLAEGGEINAYLAPLHDKESYPGGLVEIRSSDLCVIWMIFSSLQ